MDRTIADNLQDFGDEGFSEMKNVMQFTPRELKLPLGQPRDQTQYHQQGH